MFITGTARPLYVLRMSLDNLKVQWMGVQTSILWPKIEGGLKIKGHCFIFHN